MRRSIVRSPFAVVLGTLVLVASAVACGTAPAPEPERAPAAAPPEPAPEPPPTGGDIILDPSGWSMGGTALASDSTNTSAIPSGFAGGLSEISFVAGSGRAAQLLSGVTIAFSSGAQMQISTGGTGNWQCQAPGGTSFSACTTQEGNSIGSDWAPSGATITVGGNSTTLSAGSGVSITFK